MAEAGSVHTNPGGKYLGGSVSQFHTNPGGKYLGGSMAKFHTNPGGKYVYRGSDQTFHTNPGGKYVYRGWSGNYDNHHHGHSRRYGYYPWYGLPLYSYGGGCDYLYRRAVATNSGYWWDRYRGAAAFIRGYRPSGLAPRLCDRVAKPSAQVPVPGHILR